MDLFWAAVVTSWVLVLASAKTKVLDNANICITDYDHVYANSQRILLC